MTSCLIGKVFVESEGFAVAAKNTDDDFSTIAKKVVIHSVAGIADILTIGACLWLIYRCIVSERFLSDLPDLTFALGGPAMASYMVVKDLAITAAIIVMVQLIKFEIVSKLSD